MHKGLNRLGKRIQARQGSRWVRNTFENTLGFSVAVCPHCRTFNPHEIDEAPLRCHACGKGLLPDCPVHGEAACTATCPERPCPTCRQGRAVPVPAVIDPVKLRKGQLCGKCGRDLPDEPDVVDPRQQELLR